MNHMKTKQYMPKLHCKDGANVSVQASQYHYCTPREDKGPYTEVEAGFPSVTPPESWIEYAEDKDDLCGTVYAWLPVALVEEFISIHGGLDWGKVLDHGLFHVNY